MTRSSLVISALCLFACAEKPAPGASPSAATSGDKGDNKGAAPAQKAPSAGAGKAECLLSYEGKFDELLPLALAAEAIKQPADKAKKEYTPASRPLKRERLGTQEADIFAISQLSYTWDSPRMEEIPFGPAKGMKIPASDVVALSNMAIMNATYFANSYRAMTEAETAALKEKTKEKLSDPAQKKTADALGGMLQEVTNAYSEVAGLGDAARWNSVEDSLYVLVDGVKLQLRVVLSNDDQQNRDAAIALFPKLLAKCP